MSTAVTKETHRIYGGKSKADPGPTFWLRTTFSVGFFFCLRIILERAIIICDLSCCTRRNSSFPQRQLLNSHWRFLKEPRPVLGVQVGKKLQWSAGVPSLDPESQAPSAVMADSCSLNVVFHPYLMMKGQRRNSHLWRVSSTGAQNPKES